MARFSMICVVVLAVAAVMVVAKPQGGTGTGTGSTPSYPQGGNPQDCDANKKICDENAKRFSDLSASGPFAGMAKPLEENLKACENAYNGCKQGQSASSGANKPPASGSGSGTTGTRRF